MFTLHGAIVEKANGLKAPDGDTPGTDVPDRARSSAGERSLHTREAAGSIPAAPTTSAVTLGRLNGVCTVQIYTARKNRARYRIGTPRDAREFRRQFEDAMVGYRHSSTSDREVEKILKDRLRNAKNRSTRSKWECDLTLGFLIALYNANEGCCSMTGLPLDTGPVRAAGGRDRRPLRPSIDRIESTQGYTKANTRLVCSCVNYALGPWGEVFLHIMACSLARRR